MLFIILHVLSDFRHGLQVVFLYTFQKLRDDVSVSGKYEPSVLNSHILQSAFLAEEREHQQQDDWQGRNLRTRAKNVLKSLQEQTVAHAIPADCTAYSSPRQHATSLEATRLIKKANQVVKSSSLRYYFSFLWALLPLFITLFVIFERECDPEDEDPLDFFVSVSIMELIVSGFVFVIPIRIIFQTRRNSPMLKFSKIFRGSWYSNTYMLVVWMLFAFCILFTLNSLVFKKYFECIASYNKSSTATVEMTTHNTYTLNTVFK